MKTPTKNPKCDVDQIGIDDQVKPGDPCVIHLVPRFWIEKHHRTADASRFVTLLADHVGSVERDQIGPLPHFHFERLRHEADERWPTFEPFNLRIAFLVRRVRVGQVL